MSLSPQDQIKNQIESAESILLLTKPKAPSDAVCASWGFFHLLKNIGKKPVLLEGAFLKDRFKFLKNPDKIEKEIVGARDFVLSFATTRNKIIDFRTEDKLDSFEIYITPEKETIDPRDFSFIPAKFKYDLLVVLGCQNLENLGKMREKNADLFFEVPIVNIDNASANENFGQINLVGITASSLSEIIAELARTQWEKFVNSEIAQCFLTGLISATSNFQSQKTTPQTFLAASWLIEKGADQQKIIRHLLKTQSFSFMKLWGRVMARLNWDENTKLAWSLVSLEDFVQSRSKPTDLPLILEKIKDNFSAGRLFAVLYSESLEKSVALVKNSDSESLKDVQKILGGEIKNGYLEVIFPGKNIVEAEKELLEKLTKKSK
jgi:nanoRNase/pAp phosphatase (c-di-AMP/oligoRNAs hydrolase)